MHLHDLLSYLTIKCGVVGSINDALRVKNGYVPVTDTIASTGIRGCICLKCRCFMCSDLLTSFSWNCSKQLCERIETQQQAV
jgi:hypothetical protein